MNEISMKHPDSLPIFFATEMWERYGFYVVQTLLALYLIRSFHWNDQAVYELVGSFTALVYASPVVGGWIADQLLGQKRTIILGGVILLICYSILAMTSSHHTLLVALAGIAVGTGLFKPNISSLLGNEYHEDSTKRDSGFTIFYMGITTGIILGCTIPSLLNYYFNWHVSFMSASLGMLLGLMIFIFGAYRFKIHDYNPNDCDFNKILYSIISIVFLWLASFNLLSYTTLANGSFLGIVLFSILYFLHSIRKVSRAEARKTTIIGCLCIISVIFWTFYFQMFLSFTLFLSRIVEPKLFGALFPPPYYVSVQSLGAILFGLYLANRKKQTHTHSGKKYANQFLYSMLFMTAAFLLITFICTFSSNEQLLSPLLFIPAYLMISCAELLLYPVGLSAVTILSPRRKVSTMMGLFFVSLGVGGFLSGKVASLAAISPNEHTVSQLKTHYATAFTQISFILIALLFLCILLHQVIKRLSKP